MATVITFTDNDSDQPVFIVNTEKHQGLAVGAANTDKGRSDFRYEVPWPNRVKDGKVDSTVFLVVNTKQGFFQYVDHDWHLWVRTDWNGEFTKTDIGRNEGVGYFTTLEIDTEGKLNFQKTA